MRKASVKVNNELGLHARAAARLVKLASAFNSNVTLLRTDQNISADAKSILSVLTLAAAKGTMVELLIEGDDEAEAFAAIEDLFGTNFGE